MTSFHWRPASAAGAVLLGLAACTPTVQIVAPDKPIEINLNVTISQEIRIMMEPEIEELIADNPDLF
ncbi:MAG: YnbE family lipoprotein [Maricaulaceae bacterium]|jgi:hypothetical protein